MLVRGAVTFSRGLLNTPPPVMAWVGVMLVANLVFPLFFLGRPEARAVLTVMAVNALLMFAIAGRFGFVRLLGLGHVFWIPLLAWGVTRLADIPAGDLYGVWLRATLGINALSLLFDAADVVRYARGERQPMGRGP